MQPNNGTIFKFIEWKPMFSCKNNHYHIRQNLISSRLSCGANRRYILFKTTSSRTTNATHHHHATARTLLPIQRIYTERGTMSISTRQHSCVRSLLRGFNKKIISLVCSNELGFIRI